ncbi:uncharacterized protein B0I36DRAFT_251352 [Microdochium trichocladiopsis]|uniref:Uncharacterized protein n=1 Tax=Microdochium trichocladiopsis TaxID=1682393 RepID=A0A9P8Y0V0_9PEZI|nr:uncharacterized protein B0I36DRAFT_251352 [Microdochium trichocladiopsis]KAH7024786.1 hypothetical protein B0I36DRAFT_251352 [Microdochium trichocladiopsis]
MSCAQDSAFGPGLVAGTDQCREFDFTLTFERAILQVLPSTLVTFLALARSQSLYKTPKVISSSTLQGVKAILFATLGLLQIAEIGTRSRVLNDQATDRALTTAASVTAILATACLGLNACLEHTRTPGPSILVQVALSISLLLDLALLRTSWILWTPSRSDVTLLSSAALQTTISALKLGALLSESLVKHAPAAQESQMFSSEEKAGFFGRTFMTWLNPLFSLGYRADITLDSLKPVDHSLSGEATGERLQCFWAASGQTRRWRLAFALARAFRFDLFMVHVPRLGLVACAITQPLLINAVLSFMQDQVDSPQYYGYYLIAATFLTYTLLTIMTLWSQHLTFRFLTKVRGALVGSIFNSSLEMRASEGMSSAQPVTLMSTEIDRISYTLQWSLAIIPNVIQVSLGLWILQSYIDKAVIAPAIVAIAAAQVGKGIPKRQGEWTKSIQTRISITTNVLSQLKAIRMSGLQSAANRNILEARDQEISKQKSFRKQQVSNIVIGNIPAMLTPALTFSAFAIVQLVDRGGTSSFDVVVAFSSLSLLAILIMPIAELVAASINITSALTSLDRIQEFLNKNPGSGLRELGTVGDRHASSPLVSMRACSLDWAPGVTSDTQPPLLQNVDLDIRRSEIILVTGPVGCGKSLLLNAILGEAHVAAGQIRRASPSQTTYSAQTPWIPNCTLRQVVVGEGTAYDEGRYAQVVAVCQLSEDFAGVAGGEGDGAMVGSGGSRLSGGEKQRLRIVNHDSGSGNIMPSSRPNSGSGKRSDVLPARPRTAPPDEQPAPSAQVRPPGSSLVHYMSLMGPLRLFVFVAFVVVLVGCSIAQSTYSCFPGVRLTTITALWLKFWVASKTPSDSLGYWIGIYIGLAFLNIAAIGLETSAHIDFFSLRDTGEVLNLFAGDLNLIDMPLPLSFLLTTEKLASSAAEAVLTCLAGGYLAATIPVVGLAVYLTQRVYLRTSRQLRVLDLEAKASLITHFSECFEGRKNLAILDVSQKPYYLLFCLQRWLNLVLDLITAALATLLVGIAVSQREREQGVDVGYLGVGMVSVMGFGQTLGQLITHWTNLETSLGAVDRVRKYVANAPPEEDKVAMLTRSPDDDHNDDMAAVTLPYHTPAQGVLEIHDLSAKRGRSQILHDVNLSFSPGTKTAVCGRTGSGKSSLLDALLRMISLDKGNITLSGTDFAAIPTATLRRFIVALPQNALLFSGRTVRQNLDPDDRHRGEDGAARIMRVLEEVGLAELVSTTFRGSLDVVLEAECLSSGQAQLIGMARIMLRRDEGMVLLLDEATSNLNRETAATVYRLIETHFRDWTVIVVTHQVEDITRFGFDQVIVMKDGRVSKVGVPRVLLEQGASSEFGALVAHARHSSAAR